MALRLSLAIAMFTPSPAPFLPLNSRERLASSPLAAFACVFSREAITTVMELRTVFSMAHEVL